MSTKTSLRALRDYFQTLLPDVAVQDRPSGVPYQGTYPALIFSPYHRCIEQVYAGMRGSPDHDPNVYSFVYLQERAGDTSGADLSASVDTLYDHAALIEGSFSDHKDLTLPDAGGDPQVLMAGDKVTLDFDRHGPFITYLNKLHLGFVGTVTVSDLPAPNTYP